MSRQVRNQVCALDVRRGPHTGTTSLVVQPLHPAGCSLHAIERAPQNVSVMSLLTGLLLGVRCQLVHHAWAFLWQAALFRPMAIHHLGWCRGSIPLGFAALNTCSRASVPVGIVWGDPWPVSGIEYCACGKRLQRIGPQFTPCMGPTNPCMRHPPHAWLPRPARHRYQPKYPSPILIGDVTP
jgi:hypothetical protein